MGRRIGEAGPAILHRDVVIVVGAEPEVPRIKAVGERIGLKGDAIVDGAITDASAASAKGRQPRADFEQFTEELETTPPPKAF